MRSGRAPFLSLEAASFRLGDRLVFENTSWVVQSDQHWAITGPNGSGKSLLGDALRGRLPIVKGELAYHFKPEPGFTAEDCIGHVAFEDRKAAIHDQVVQSRWQSSEQEQGQTVREALAYESVMSVNPFEVTDVHQRQKPRFEQRSRRAVRLVGMESLLDRKLIVLSNGETQKVQLARVLSLPLSLLILDEPFIGLDRASRRHFARVLDDLMSGPMRVILITANPDHLPRKITHLMRVENCRVIEAVRLTKGQKEEGTGRALTTRRARPLPGSATASGSTRSPLPSFSTITQSPRLTKFSRRVQSSANKEGFSRSSSATELVRMRNVTVNYGNITILRNVNWTVRPGESWALFGPNGSGKTTLLSLIMGDHPQAYANDITVLGRRHGEGESIQNLKKQIGWVSPELQVYFQDSFTCLETVESGFQETIGLYQEVTAAQRRAAMQWLKRFGLKSSAHAPLFELSAGLQRTVLLARALVKKPRLLILDEPCQGLDEAHQQLFLQILDSLLPAGNETAIYVTHRPEEIPPAIQRVLRLKNSHAHPY